MRERKQRRLKQEEFSSHFDGHSLSVARETIQIILRESRHDLAVALLEPTKPLQATKHTLMS